jgi:ferredoxin-NADP reductase
MIGFLNDWLNSITMYRLAIYCLAVLVGLAAFLAIAGLLPFAPLPLVFSASFLIVISLLSNSLFSRILEVPSNTESVWITSLILALIMTPADSLSGYWILFWAAVLAMASKYILTVANKHVFNPAALAAALTALLFETSASWWVGTSAMLLPVLITGLLIARKIQREDMLFYFFVTAFIVTGFSGVVVIHTALFFFGFVMLTDPRTSPPTRFLQAIYAVLVGILFAPRLHLGSFYFTPELTLLAGNIFSFIVSPRLKLVLKLKEKIPQSPDTFDFIFPLPGKIAFAPGQYMELTLPHKNSDSRGLRRYFTLASSPTEDNIRVGVKFYRPGSSFKKALSALDGQSPVVASQLSGDFTLPKNDQQKLVFIAGGIGITPFRSMLKYLLDTGKKRDIVLLYSNRTAADIIYRDVLDEVQKRLGIRIIYTLTDKSLIPPSWRGRTGRVDETMLRGEIPDYRDRKFYLSGPHTLVSGFEETLKSMGVPEGRIIKDFFPGFV